MLSDRLAYQIKRTQHTLRLAMDAILRPLGLTTPQYATLTACANHPGASNAALAREVFVTPQTMNELVRALVARGLLDRRPHHVHKRVIQLSLTPAGAAVLEQAHQQVQLVEDQMIAGISPATVQALAEGLAACADRLLGSGLAADPAGG